MNNMKNNSEKKKKEEEATTTTKEKLEEYVDKNFNSVYQEHTRILSSTCRQLALGEGGLCWLFKSFTYGQCISYQVNVVIIMLVLFFLFDVSQYLISSILYKNKVEEFYEKINNRQINKKSQLFESTSMRKPGSICFTIKFCILVFASVYLIFLILKI